MDTNFQDNQKEKLTLNDIVFFFSISALPPIVLNGIFIALSFWAYPIESANQQNVLMLSGVIAIFSILLGAYFCKVQRGCLTGVILTLIISAGLFLLPFVAGVSGKFMTLWLIGCGIFVIPIAFMLWVLAGKLLADKKAVVESFEITPEKLELGKGLDYKISFIPKVQIQPTKIILVLRCNEMRKEEEGFKTNDIHFEEKVLSQSESYMPNVPYAFTGSFKIPVSSNLSVDIDKHKVRWTLEFKIQLKNWIDIGMTKDLTVLTE
jgi:hypothetical protein